MKLGRKYRMGIAYFLIFLVLSISVIGAAGSQNGLDISSPSNIVSAPSISVIDSGSLSFQVCAEIIGSCTGDCDRVLGYIDIKKLVMADPLQSFDEAALDGMVAADTDPAANQPVVFHADGTSEIGTQCFDVSFSEQGYYRIEIGAFGSPGYGGISTSYSTGYVRVRTADTIMCRPDGEIGDTHEFICNDDGTTQQCNSDATGYEESGHCKDGCDNVYPYCDGMKPNPDCKSSCISDDGTTVEITGNDEITEIMIVRPDGYWVSIAIWEGYIYSAEVNGEEATVENDPGLVQELTSYNEENYDTGLSKNTHEEHPEAEVVPFVQQPAGSEIPTYAELNLEYLEVGDGSNIQDYMQYDVVGFELRATGEKESNASIFSYLIGSDGERNLVRVSEIRFDSSGNAELREEFYPLVEDGSYKFIAEAYQLEEKRDYMYWKGEREDEGVLNINFDAAALTAQARADLPSDEELGELFRQYMIARQEKSPHGARDEFRAFMEAYLRTRYPNDEDYNKALEILSDENIDKLIDEFEKTFANERLVLYFDQAIMASDMIKQILEQRLDIFEGGFLKSHWSLLLDPASLIEYGANIIIGASSSHKEMIVFRIAQIENIQGVFLLSKSIDYSANYPVIADSATSDEDIAGIFAIAEPEDGDINRIRRTYSDYVLTRDLMKYIAEDSAAGATYEYGWMFFYTGLRVYDGDPADYTDYPLGLQGGGSVGKEDYYGVGDAAHDSLSKADTTWGLSIEEDVIMQKALFEAATTTFVNVTEIYPESEYAPMAEERLGEIKGIIFRQNLLKALKFIASSVIAILFGVGITKIFASISTKVAQVVGKAASLLFYVVAGFQAVTIAVNCPRYLFGGSKNRVESIMSAGEVLPNCVAPLVDFLIFTAGINMLKKYDFFKTLFKSSSLKEKINKIAPEVKPSGTTGSAGTAKVPDASTPRPAASAVVNNNLDDIMKDLDNIMAAKLTRSQKYTRVLELQRARKLDMDSLENLLRVQYGWSDAEISGVRARFKPVDDEILKTKQVLGEKTAVTPEAQARAVSRQELDNFAKQGVWEDITAEQIKKWGGIGSGSQELALKNGWRKSPDQVWLYNRAGMAKIEQMKMRMGDGHDVQFKLHITSSNDNFDDVIRQMGNFLDAEGIPAKVAPGDYILQPSRAQYGKVFTIYVQNQDDMLKVVGQAEKLAASGYKGIPYKTFSEIGANMQYELPVKGTNDLVYLAAEKLDGVGLQYHQRLGLLSKYWSELPLELVPGS